MLPKIKYPTFQIEIPNIGSKYTMRQMTVADEKVLLVAAASESDIEIKRAIGTIVQNCVEEKIDLETIPSFELEYLYIKLWSISVNNKIRVENNLGDALEIDLTKLDLVVPKEAQTKKFVIDDETALVMKYLSLTELEEVGLEAKNDIGNSIITMLKKSIEYVIVGDEILYLDDYKDDEILNFLESIPSATLEKIKNFFGNQPYVQIPIGDGSYVKSLDNFFQLLSLRMA